MKKILSTVLAGTMVLSLAACGSQGSGTAETTAAQTTAAQTTAAATEAAKEETTKAAETGGQVEITFWHAMSGVNEEALQKITDDFMSENPNIKVTMMNQGGYLDLFD